MMDRKINRPPVISFLVILVVLLGFLSLMIGPARYPATKILNAVFMNGTSDAVGVLWQDRIPRLILAIIAGGMISAGGAVTLSVYGTSFFDRIYVKLYFVVIAFIALVSAVTALFGRAFTSIDFWLLGSLSAGGWMKIWMMLPFALIGLIIIFMYFRDLNALLFGEYTAKTLGIETKQAIPLLTGLAAVLSLVGAFACGVAGLSAMALPYLIRAYSGENNKYLIPSSILGGASLVIFCDIISRIIAPAEVPLGITLVLICGPIYIFALQRRRQGR